MSYSTPNRKRYYEQRDHWSHRSHRGNQRDHSASSNKSAATSLDPRLKHSRESERIDDVHSRRISASELITPNNRGQRIAQDNRGQKIAQDSRGQRAAQDAPIQSPDQPQQTNNVSRLLASLSSSDRSNRIPFTDMSSIDELISLYPDVFPQHRDADQTREEKENDRQKIRQLEDQCKKLRSERDEAVTTQGAVAKQLEETTKTGHDMECQIEKLVHDLNESKKDSERKIRHLKSEHESKLGDVREQNRQIVEQHQGLATRHTVLENEHTILKTKYRTLKTDYETLETDHRRLSESSSGRIIELLTTSNKEKDEAIQRLKEEFKQEKAKMINEYGSLVEEKTAKIENMTEEIEKKRDQIRNANNDLFKAIAEKNGLKIKYQQSLNKVKERDATMESKESELHQREEALRMMKEQIQKLEDEYQSTLNNITDEYEQRLAKEASEKEGLCQEKEHQAEQIRSLEEEIDSLKDEIGALTIERDSKVREIANMEQVHRERLGALEETINADRRNREELIADKQQLELDKNTLLKIKEEQGQALVKLQAANDSLKQEKSQDDKDKKNLLTSLNRTLGHNKVFQRAIDKVTEEKNKIIEESRRAIEKVTEEKNKIIEESRRAIEEKNKTIEERDKTIQELNATQEASRAHIERLRTSLDEAVKSDDHWRRKCYSLASSSTNH